MHHRSSIIACASLFRHRPAHCTVCTLQQLGVRTFRFMIPTSTLGAARGVMAGPLAFFERHWTRPLSLNQNRRQCLNTEAPASNHSGRRPPQPVSTTKKLEPRTDPPPLSSRIGPKPVHRRGEPKTLEPYYLSKRLTTLVSRGLLEEAVEMLKNSPQDASNVTTWNTLLLHCMTKERFKLAYKLFIDVRVFPCSGLVMVNVTRVSTDEETRFQTQYTDVQRPPWRLISDRELEGAHQPIQERASDMARISSICRDLQGGRL